MCLCVAAYLSYALCCRQQSRFDITASRNLLRILHSNERVKRLIVGKEKVIKFYTEDFPNSKHLLETLTVDVVHESVSEFNHILQLCLTKASDHECFCAG